jgi:hypothetical protein
MQFQFARRPRNLLTGEADLGFRELELEETSQMSTRPWDLWLREKADRDRSRPN